MSAAALLAECVATGVALAADGDKLRIKAKTTPPSQMMDALRIHKAELMRLLAADRLARVRKRFAAACQRLGIDPEPVMRQFDYWKYPEHELAEMDGWPDETVEAHCLLLERELSESPKDHQHA